MATNKCCVPNCTQKRLGNTILHLFPKPELEPVRFDCWRRAIGGDILNMDPTVILKNCRVCQNHFDDKSYTQNRRLSTNAIPTLNLSNVQSNESETIGAPTIILLQVDTSINAAQQVFPLHLLQNPLDYGQQQFLIPTVTSDHKNQNQVILQDQFQAIEGSQKKVFNIGLDVNASNTNVRKQYIPIPKTPTRTPEYVVAKPTLVHKSQIVKSMINKSKEEDNSLNKNSAKSKIQNYVHIPDRNIPPRAVAVLPTVLQIRARDVIYPRRTLPARARFGPVQGIKKHVSQSETSELIFKSNEDKIPIFLLRDEYGNTVHVDVSDKDKSNWIGLLPLGDDTTANIWLYEESHELYAITTEPLACRQALVLGYSKKYAEDYGIIGQPTKDIKTEVPKVSKPWVCYECQRVMSSASMLQRHMDVYHKEENTVSRRRRYQCRNCSRTFCRLFTLRRHRLRHCTQRPDKRDNLSSSYTLPDVGLNPVPNAEDNRIPSDESFQNYSNGLDFSTNLFDTDRMPSLDISRSEGEFNPYSIGYKDDNVLANALGFTNTCATGSEIPEKEPIQEEILFTCTYCNEVVVKEKKRQHIRACPARRFECECGKVFTNKKLLANHIHTQHVNDLPEKTDQSTTSNDTTLLKCEKCGHTFKRRGMLVNHLWRVHKSVCATVPLQRRIRHYPCVACPKIYRTAAKRNRHVDKHHPGAEKINAIRLIEGGVQSCQPAMCPACPRQYSTRAKLLQHQRAIHPHLAPPPTRKHLKPTSDNVNIRIVAEELVKFRTGYNQMY